MVYVVNNSPRVGDMCAESVQCGHYCNNEVVTAKKTPVREELFFNMKVVTFCIFGVVLLLVSALVVSDGVHSHLHLLPTYSDVPDDKEVLLEYISHLEAKQAIDRAEKQLGRRGSDEELSSSKKKKRTKAVISGARAIMNRQYGKRRIGLHAVHSGSNENKKYVHAVAYGYKSIGYHILSDSDVIYL